MCVYMRTPIDHVHICLHSILYIVSYRRKFLNWLHSNYVLCPVPFSILLPAVFFLPFTSSLLLFLQLSTDSTFSIDATTGVLTVSNSVDRESNPTYELIVEVHTYAPQYTLSLFVKPNIKSRKSFKCRTHLIDYFLEENLNDEYLEWIQYTLCLCGPATVQCV